jgi:hypothetical protein
MRLYSKASTNGWLYSKSEEMAHGKRSSDVDPRAKQSRPPKPERLPMSEKRTAANRRNAKLSTGPISTKGKRKSALNAVKHGLSIPTDRADDTVLALAALLSPTAASGHISALAVEAARRIVDFNRVKRAYLVLYAGLGSDPILIDPATQPATECGLAALAASLIKLYQPPTARPLTITGLAKQLDKLARYERRALSLRERALGELAEAIAGERLQHETEMPDRPQS